MKNLLPHAGLFLIVLLLLGAQPILAQDELGAPRESQPAQNELNQDIPDLDSKTNSKSAVSSSSGRETTRDSVAVKPTVSKKTESKTQEEDILSYNFLYYIIQRFKLSDIVD
jgi:hypothetical protein